MINKIVKISNVTKSEDETNTYFTLEYTEKKLFRKKITKIENMFMARMKYNNEGYMYSFNKLDGSSFSPVQTFQHVLRERLNNNVY